MCVCVCGVVWCGVLEKGKRERGREGGRERGREGGREREWEGQRERERDYLEVQTDLRNRLTYVPTEAPGV